MTTQTPQKKLSQLEGEVVASQKSLSTAGLALTNPANFSWDAGCKAYTGYMAVLQTHNTAVSTFRTEVDRLVSRPPNIKNGVLSPFNPENGNPDRTDASQTADGSQSDQPSGPHRDAATPNSNSDVTPSTPETSTPRPSTPASPSGQVSNITQYQPRVVTTYGGGEVTVSFDNTKNIWVAKWKRLDMDEPFLVFESNAGRPLSGADFAEGTLGRKNLDAAVFRYRREKKDVSSVPSTKPSPTARDIVVAGKDGLQLTPESLDERKYVGVRDGRQVLVGRLKNSKHWFVLTPGENNEDFKYYQIGEKRPSDDDIRAKILGGGFTTAWGREGTPVSGRFVGTVSNVPSNGPSVEVGENGLMVNNPGDLGDRRYVGLESGPVSRVLVGSVTGSTGAKVWFVLTPKEGGGVQSYQLVLKGKQTPTDRAREMLENGSFSRVWDSDGKPATFIKPNKP